VEGKLNMSDRVFQDQEVDRNQEQEDSLVFTMEKKDIIKRIVSFGRRNKN